jgi:hypothetical protein
MRTQALADFLHIKVVVNSTLGVLMKIQNDPLHPLLGQGETQRKPGAGTEEFEALLARELQRGQESAAPGLTRSPGQDTAVLAMQIRAAEELGLSLDPELAGKEESFEKVNSLLDKLSLYAESLGRSQGNDLRALHGMLGGVSAEIASLKETLPSDPEGSGLESLITELEVLAVTERFKFDRGDYL